MQNYLKLNDVPLKKYNTLQLESLAKSVYFPLNKDGLIEVLSETKTHKRILIGKGSNILLKKDVYPEDNAFIITTLMDEIHIENDEIYCDAGVSLSQLAWFAIEHSIDGYAFAEDIPGTVGGALIMNAGQYQYTIGQYVNWIDVYDTELNSIKRIIPNESFFSYRNAAFKSTEFVVACGLKNQGGDDLENLEKVLNYKRERYRKQPRNYPNAGSVFKRPVKDGETLFVWKLFEACGLRGKRVGGAELSFKHPGFIVNVNHASTKDVFDLIELCKTSVKEKFDVDLELEWKVIE
ncbi:MAG TPA: UDP-N-acetylmuramate dehydrogenase [Erysipelotrichaceae bacterium]|nr:UDP-N-acetylmuramate dehydrogenase [Erysipelotrichaceae bacterium]